MMNVWNIVKNGLNTVVNWLKNNPKAVAGFAIGFYLWYITSFFRLVMFL